MSSRLGDIPFLSLLPESIREDRQLADAAKALDGLLQRTTAAIPDLLVFSRLDRDTANFLPPLARLTEAAGGLKPLSPELLELLAWQFHVDFRETARTREQLEGMVRRSIPWHRIKGTPASVKDALALFGLAAELEEDGVDDYWATYQIGLPSIVDMETVKLVCRVAYEMHPARCSLYRIYTNVWDTRPGTYSDGRYSEAAYSFYSGVPVPGLPGGDDLIVSFGRLTSAQAAPPVLTNVLRGRIRERGVTVLFDDDMQYSAAVYSDSVMPANHGFVRSRLNAMVIGRPVYRHHTWAGQWDGRKWAELESIGYARDPFTLARRSLAAIEGTYSESAYGDMNTFYAQPVYDLVDAPPAYSDAVYSEHDPLRHRLVVDEMFWSGRNAQPDPLLPPGAGGASKITRCGEHQAQTVQLLTRPTVWSDNWDTRLWRAGGAYANLNHTEVET